MNESIDDVGRNRRNSISFGWLGHGDAVDLGEAERGSLAVSSRKVIFGEGAVISRLPVFASAAVKAWIGPVDGAIGDGREEDGRLLESRCVVVVGADDADCDVSLSRPSVGAGENGGDDDQLVLGLFLAVQLDERRYLPGGGVDPEFVVISVAPKIVGVEGVVSVVAVRGRHFDDG